MRKLRYVYYDYFIVILIHFAEGSNLHGKINALILVLLFIIHYYYFSISVQLYTIYLLFILFLELFFSY